MSASEPQHQPETTEPVPAWCSECDCALKLYTLDAKTRDGADLHIESLACQECGYEVSGHVREWKEQP